MNFHSAGSQLQCKKFDDPEFTMPQENPNKSHSYAVCGQRDVWPAPAVQSMSINNIPAGAPDIVLLNQASMWKPSEFLTYTIVKLKITSFFLKPVNLRIVYYAGIITEHLQGDWATKDTLNSFLCFL